MRLRFRGKPIFTVLPVSAEIEITEMLSGLNPKRFEPESAPISKMLYRPFCGSSEPELTNILLTKLLAVMAVDPIVPVIKEAIKPVMARKAMIIGLALLVTAGRFINRSESKVKKTINAA